MAALAAVGVLAPALATPARVREFRKARVVLDSQLRKVASVMRTPAASTFSLATVPVFDIHAHVIAGTQAQRLEYVDCLVARAREAGVRKTALGLHAKSRTARGPKYSRNHDAWVLEAWRRYPDDIVPLLAGFDPEWPDCVSYVESQLSTGPWRGIGELDLRNVWKRTDTPADTPALMQVYKLAARFRVPVLIHHGATDVASEEVATREMARAASINPATDFILGHSEGCDSLFVFPNIYASVDPGSGAVPRVCASRVMLGSDVQDIVDLIEPPEDLPGMARPIFNYRQAIGLLRNRLSLMNRSAAEACSFRTAERLFGVSCM